MTGPDAPTPAPAPSPRRAWWAAVAQSPMSVPAFVLALTAARLVWMVWFSDYTLIEDEAHYWEWSRRPAWSYYSKGPGVAWAIWAATAVLGHTEWAVRLPAVLASAVGSFAAAGLTRTLLDRPGAPFVAAVLYQCLPPVAIVSVLMTIDGPLLACWMLAAWGAAAALARGRPRGWLAFGVAMGAGFLFKYTILLLLPGVLLAAVLRPQWRARLGGQRRWFVAGLAVAGLGLVPVLVWNAQHDWATVRHLLGHLGAPGGDTAPRGSWSLLGTLAHVGEYTALLVVMGGPAAWLGAAAWAERSRVRAGVAFAWCCGAPIVGLYLLVSLVTHVEGNWAIAALATLVAPAAWLVVDGVERRDVAVRWLWGGAIGVGVAVNASLPVLPALSRVGRLGARIPVHRMSGMREHAAAVQHQADALAARTGLDPFVMSEHYGRASQLAFYLPGHPTVYCASSVLGGRRTQYDEWAATDLRDPATTATLRGRPAVLLRGERELWAGAFEHVGDIGPLPGESKRGQTACIGEGFTGFAGAAGAGP